MPNHGITDWAVEVVFKHPHLPLLPAAAWSAIGVVLLFGRRNRAFGLAGGVSVAGTIAWLVFWLLNIESAADDMVSAHLLGLGLELTGMLWLTVLIGVIVFMSVVAGLVAEAVR